MTYKCIQCGAIATRGEAEQIARDLAYREPVNAEGERLEYRVVQS